MTDSHKIILCGEQSPAELTIRPDDIPGASGNWHVQKRTLRAGRSAGVELIEVENGAQRLFILPTRGMGLWKIVSSGTRVGWDSPVREPVHPMFVDPRSRNRLGWLDGFNELIARCGLTSNGPPGDDEEAGPFESELTLHGRIANLPAHHVEFEYREAEQGPELIIRGEVREATLFGQHLVLDAEYRTSLESHEVTMTDRVTNQLERPAELELLYHINIGQPILEEGSRWYAPLKRLTPRDPRATEEIDTYAEYKKPTQGYAEEAFFCQPIADANSQSRALVTDATGNQGFRVIFDTQSLPCLTIWKNTQSLSEGYCTGLEPGTNFPNFKAQERREGRVVPLEPLGQWSSTMKLAYLGDQRSIEEELTTIRSLQGETELKIDHELVRGISGD